MFEAYSCLGILDAFAEASTDAVERPGQFFDNMKMIDDDRDGPGVKFCVSDFRQSQEWRWKAGRILA